MQTKLTLRLDDRLIKRAKRYARRSGKSLSQVVAEYFAALTARREPAGGGDDGGPGSDTPTVAMLRGALKGKTIDEDDYRAYLEKKHG